MSWFAIFSLLCIGAVGGYTIGHSTGKEEGYLDGLAEMYEHEKNR